MRVYLQFRNVYKEFELVKEFDMRDEFDMKEKEYDWIKMKYENAKAQHENAMDQYVKEMKEHKEGKRDKEPVHPGNGPNYEANFEPQYEAFKSKLERRWHKVEFEGANKMTFQEFMDRAVEKVLKMDNSKLLATGIVRAMLQNDRPPPKETLLSNTDMVSDGDRIILEFIR